MTNYVTRNLKQTVTYWAPGGNDGFGGVAFDAPIQINGRWEDRTELYTDEQGNEQKARARIYVDQDVELRGYVFLGTSTSTAPESVSGAYEIKDFRKTPNLAATIFERRILI